MSQEQSLSSEPLAYQSANLDFPPIRSRAKIARRLLMALIVLLILAAPVLLATPWFTALARPPVLPGNAMTLIVGGLSMCLFGALQTAVSITFIVFFCMWVHAANRAARVTGTQGMAYTPGWAVGWFFIPFANLVVPFGVMNELWKASDPVPPGENWRNVKPPMALGFWWGTWLLSGFLSMTGAIIGMILKEQGAWPKAWLDVAGALVQAVAAAVLLVIIRRITERLLLRTGQSPE